jgi:hypothetical protein
MHHRVRVLPLGIDLVPGTEIVAHDARREIQRQRGGPVCRLRLARLEDRIALERDVALVDRGHTGTLARRHPARSAKVEA